MRRTHPGFSADCSRFGLTLAFLLLLPGLLLACSRVVNTHKRWVSLSPSINEVLFAVSAGPEVSGLCSPADYPAAASALPKVASWQKVDVETIVAASPDYCFTIDGMQPPRILNTLRRLGVKVRSYPMENLNDLFRCIESIGDLTGHVQEARHLVSGMKRQISSARVGLPSAPVNAVIVVGIKPLVVAGGNSFMDDMLRVASFRNPLSDRGENWPQVSIETVALARPDVIVYPQGEFPRKDIESFLRELDKLLDKPVHPLGVDADLLSRPGPRTPQAIEQLCEERKEAEKP